MEEKIKNSSYKVRPFSEEERSKWKRVTKNDVHEYIRVGPQGYVLPAAWLEYSEEIRKMPLRSSDIWVATTPRSGTTWTQEMVWLINNNLDFETAKATSLFKRYPFLEFYMIYNPLAKVLLKECKDEKSRKIITDMLTPAHEILANTSSPRFIKTHHPLSLMPEGVLDTCKVVYVTRDPRDVLVSLYHFFSINRMHAVDCELKDFFDVFINDLTIWGPFFEHIKEAWAQRHHPNMLFLSYEELSKDLKNTAKRVADFFGKTYTEKQYDQLCEHLAFKNFQNNKSISDLEDWVKIGIVTVNDISKNFVRKGKSGGWRDHFDEEMTARAQAWILRNLQDTDFRFPHMEL